MGTRAPNLLCDIKLYLYGVHKNEARNGIKLDLIGENNAFQQYSSGEMPSISRYLSKNVFFTDEEIYSYKSLSKAIFWNRHSAYLENKSIDEDDQLVESLQL